MSNNPLNRILSEVRDAQKSGISTLHNVYTSGLFEEASDPLERVLEEVKKVEQETELSTLHNVYTSGIFEDEGA